MRAGKKKEPGASVFFILQSKKSRLAVNKIFFLHNFLSNTAVMGVRKGWDLHMWNTGVTMLRIFWKNMHKSFQHVSPLPAWCNTCCWLDGCTDPRPVVASPDPALLSSWAPPATREPVCSKIPTPAGFCQPCPASRSVAQQLDYLINHLISGCFV